MSEDFERLAPQVARALDQAWGYTLDDVRVAVESGKMQLWPGQKSAIITQVLERPQGRELYFFLAAGDMEEVQRLYKIVIAWGQSKGCKHAAFVGRRGWSKSFLTREEGWKAKHVVYEREITP
ncbi:hypothetical protein LCGC14_1420940 [marine sediment metagenome]|uniref:Uncharacterized protein n=1 Tax=marine sediment metagenome TaxID=412755 RepID=A0A0F9JRX2_9ZZZZ